MSGLFSTLDTCKPDLIAPDWLPLACENKARRALQAQPRSSAQWRQQCESLFAALPREHFVGQGFCRVVFSSPDSNIVVKVPRDYESAQSNQLEVAYYEQQAFYGHPVVPCRLVWSANLVPIVVMEKVDTESFGNATLDDENRWGLLNDGGQIAWSDMLGQWAAFDATYPLNNDPRLKTMYFPDMMQQEYSRLVEWPLPTDSDICPLPLEPAGQPVDTQA